MADMEVGRPQTGKLADSRHRSLIEDRGDDVNKAVNRCVRLYSPLISCIDRCILLHTFNITFEPGNTIGPKAGLTASICISIIHLPNSGRQRAE